MELLLQPTHFGVSRALASRAGERVVRLSRRAELLLPVLEQAAGDAEIMRDGGQAAPLAALVSGEHFTLQMFSFRSTVALLYLAVFGSVIAYTAYNYAQSKLSAGRVSSYAYVNPVIAVLTGAVLLHEPVTWRMIGAMVIILAGVLLIQIERRSAAARATRA